MTMAEQQTPTEPFDLQAENLYYPPPGYKDGPVLASFKIEREARRAAAEANAGRSWEL